MAQQRIVKRAYCKRAVFLDTSNHTTGQARLASALAKLKTIGARKEQLGDSHSPSYIRSIIYHRNMQSVLFGILAGYERGTHQLTVADDDDAEMLTLDRVAPPLSEQRKRQEFLEGVCYFGAYKNHLIVVPSRALGVKPLENHANWLLQKAGTLKSNDRLGLSEQIAVATKDRIKESHVREIRVGAPLIQPLAEEPQDSHGRRRGRTAEVEYGGFGVEVLQQLLGREKLDKLRLVDAIDGNIEVSLRIRYRRTTHESAHKFLDNVALAIRNLDEDDVTLKLADGGTVRGDELKLSTPMTVDGRDGIPNPDELFSSMRDWLRGLLDGGTIEP
jgi:hypothetical protein